MQSEGIVHVVDDDAAMRESLLLLLTSAGMDARAYDSAAALLAALEAGTEDTARCLVTDLHMPDVGGLELQARLAGSPHAMPVVVITGQGDVPGAVRALKAGAVDFIEKPFSTDVLLDCVTEALARDRGSRTQAARARAAELRLAALTAREREVMDKLLDGNANKVVAIDLGISERTVEQHRASLMRKLSVRTVTELLELAIAAGHRMP
ncbi:MAG: response regulator transcription factor [Planctomycetes bacterium]|nr:response regulator transcription factor [Planctomycetota bacterium]